MTTLLQISDMHFGTEQPDVVAALQVLSTEKSPDVLIVSGDITQRASDEQFRSAKGFCDRLQIAQMVCIPGNHDIPLFNLWARTLHPYAAYKRAFGPVLEPLLFTDSLCIITVNTTRWWRHKNGQVSQAQIERVRGHLSRATSRQLRLVVVHQPVHVLRGEDEHDLLRGCQSAVRAWSEAGADLVMGGHIHLPYVRELSATVGGLKRRMWCVQAGTAVSRRVRREAPNSVNLIHFSSAQATQHCTVERWDYQAATGRFALVDTSALTLQRP